MGFVFPTLVSLFSSPILTSFCISIIISGWWECPFSSLFPSPNWWPWSEISGRGGGGTRSNITHNPFWPSRLNRWLRLERPLFWAVGPPLSVFFSYSWRQATSSTSSLLLWFQLFLFVSWLYAFIPVWCSWQRSNALRYLPPSCCDVNTQPRSSNWPGMDLKPFFPIFIIPILTTV